MRKLYCCPSTAIACNTRRKEEGGGIAKNACMHCTSCGSCMVSVVVGNPDRPVKPDLKALWGREAFERAQIVPQASAQQYCSKRERSMCVVCAGLVMGRPTPGSVVQHWACMTLVCVETLFSFLALFNFPIGPPPPPPPLLLLLMLVWPVEVWKSLLGGDNGEGNKVFYSAH